jgi:hypothetical protein
MDEILNVSTLPEPLHRRIRCERVRIREEDGVILLIPISETTAGEESKPHRICMGFVDGPPLPDSFFDPLPEEELQSWGL